jgi:hypothetical protein
MSSLMDKLEKSLNSADICNIIRACRKSGVKNFKLGTLEINFDADQVQANSWPTHTQYQSV